MTPDEVEARRRCVEQGIDPDYVGEKGYANWKDFTKAQRDKVQEFLDFQAALFGMEPIKLS